MPTNFCEHLDQYGSQYTRTEASYQQCMNLLDRIMSTGPDTELVALVTTALGEWSAEDAKLREMLVDEVRDGRIRVPLALVRGRHILNTKQQRKPHHPGRLVCATCCFVVPRLVYPEWKIAHNGVASFKGQELPVTAAV